MDATGPDDAEKRAVRPDPEATEVWQAPASDSPDAGAPPDPPAEVDDPNLARFARDAAEVGLLDPSEISAFLRAFPAAERPRDAKRLARELVTARRLTAYQAGAIVQGKARGLVIGRFVVLEKLGAGGMGVVFKAEQRTLRRVVALKISPPSITREPEAVTRFHREAEAAAKLDHPNLVRAIDADEAGGMHFLVMEYVEGRDLSRMVRERGPLATARAGAAVIPAARGVAAAHTCADHPSRHQAVEPHPGRLKGRSRCSTSASPGSTTRTSPAWTAAG